jgi:hypothetical protein
MPDEHALTLRQADQARTDFATINVGSCLKNYPSRGHCSGYILFCGQLSIFLFQVFGNILEFRLSVNDLVRSFAVISTAPINRGNLRLSMHRFIVQSWFGLTLIICVRVITPLSLRMSLPDGYLHLTSKFGYKFN